MASPLDGPMGKLAATLTKTFGRAATLRRPGSGGSYNPATGTITGGSADVDYPCEIVFEEFADSQIDDTLIQAGDRKAIVARQTIGVQPNPDSDTLIVGSDTWQIVRVLGYSSGESEAAYSLHVRR